MDLDELIVYLQKLQNEGKGKYKAQAHDIDYNTANGGNYIINEKTGLNGGNIIINDDEQSITFGDYSEYYSY